MIFPTSNRVRYQRTPLVEVICQLRFPPILMIDRAPPAEFQERVRADLPGYQRKHNVDITPGMLLVGGDQPLALPAQAQDRRTEHLFLSNDGQEKISLGRDFIALSTVRYAGWEHFLARFDMALRSLHGAYSPAHFVRVGLRYQNVIRRSVLGLEGVPWRDLLRPALIGLLAEADPVPDHVAHEAVYTLAPAPARTRLSHGLVDADGEPSYLIDTDFFVEGQLSLDESQRWLVTLHDHAGSLFRWCVLDRLHQAMGPEEIDAA